MHSPRSINTFFFFNDTATTEIYTLSLHDALPISYIRSRTRGDLNNLSAVLIPFEQPAIRPNVYGILPYDVPNRVDRKSTRLNSSHGYISYAVFCLKKKKNTTISSNILGNFVILYV